MWIIYSIVLWIVSLVYFAFEMNKPEMQTGDLVYAGLPVLLLPFCIYYIRRFLVWFYDRKQKKEEESLATLRKEQKLKLEELKKKTSYYTTQSLLERYDEALAKKKEEALKAERAQQELRQRKPVSMPANHSRPPNFPPARPAGAPQQQQQQQPNQQQHLQNPQQMQQQQYNQPIIPQTRSEPQWYDRLVDALVGDAGPETKYALICTHCFTHNGLVLKEEFETIQYVCPNCKQFNPSKKAQKAVLEPLQEKVKESIAEEDMDEVLEKMKAEHASDEQNDDTIASRVRQRHSLDEQDDEE
ncbi:hypothetical protein K501DRAFT_244106 [Backusella circina FSU 941]|nr:hypothetical protein K501DRAFT_244106 [Backusella circina FSU 941]